MQAQEDRRATFAYKQNDSMADDVKDALANFDLDKTGRVSTSELVAGAKALQEVRGQNLFMRRVLCVHAVSMLLLLGGVFGLSVTASELSKEVKVAQDVLVTPDGHRVQVESADLSVSPYGELQARQAGGAVRAAPSVMVVHAGTQAEDFEALLPGDGVVLAYEDGGRRLAANPCANSAANKCKYVLGECAWHGVITGWWKKEDGTKSWHLTMHGKPQEGGLKDFVMSVVIDCDRKSCQERRDWNNAAELVGNVHFCYSQQDAGNEGDYR